MPPRRNLLLVIALAAVAVTGIARFANAAPPSRVASLEADVAEWSIVPSTGVVPAGRVRITVRNLGAKTHSLEVVRTDTFAEQLQMHGSHVVAQPVGRSLTVGAGAQKSFVVRLAPGSYVLLDKLPWSYWRGMSVAFAVR
jgi:uncharacterized cupredoxin-like copper-binding protein